MLLILHNVEKEIYVSTKHNKYRKEITSTSIRNTAEGAHQHLSKRTKTKKLILLHSRNSEKIVRNQRYLYSLVAGKENIVFIPRKEIMNKTFRLFRFFLSSSISTDNKMETDRYEKYRVT